MTIDFYYMPPSAPCRSVLLTAKALGVKLNLKVTDLMKGDHLAPAFIKLNPQHTIPTLDDNGFILWESRPIMAYLVDQYGKDDSLYPKDPKKRAIVDQRLYFDATVLYQRNSEYYYPIWTGQAPEDLEKKKKVDEAFGFFNLFLEGKKYAAGDQLTIADFALYVTTANVSCTDEPQVKKHPNVYAWLQRMHKEASDAEGIAAFKEILTVLAAKR